MNARGTDRTVAAGAPIVVFDSGVGGLSVVKAIRATLPQAPLVYVMDRAAYPYGEQSESVLLARVPALLGRLAERHAPRLIVIACNTASTITLAAVREALHVPIVGTVPAIKPAAGSTRRGVIGILGTAATVRQRYVDDLTARFAGSCTVLRHGAPALVDYAEARLRGQPADETAPRDALASLIQQPGGDAMDTVVLACTHFPLVAEALQRDAPHPLTFVDGAAGIAARCAALTAGQPWPDRAATGLTLTTGGLAECRDLTGALASFDLAPAKRF
ncbi:glutamate racemase [Salinisphaera sp. Q1T1-3]|uniref:glutamate racemase n=1 Tax=Salinisphaera sp. Q1T1-3 TaxID=2321229 RepID=UPI000E763E62|nr:glutamate racemase [Salinisphaera sp. Q1T1-3]RJS93076.1 glutamate racemase [Salinisphaera sp. Q1T1-3]